MDVLTRPFFMAWCVNILLIPSATGILEIITPSTIQSGESSSIPKLISSKAPFRDERSSTAFSVLEPISRPTTCLLRLRRLSIICVPRCPCFLEGHLEDCFFDASDSSFFLWECLSYIKHPATLIVLFVKPIAFFLKFMVTKITNGQDSARNLLGISGESSAQTAFGGHFAAGCRGREPIQIVNWKSVRSGRR
jgi:hypothetical protein